MAFSQLETDSTPHNIVLTRTSEESVYDDAERERERERELLQYLVST
jgi:hypothetical protein